jgi:putative nucleotidyltransferase with HDIG domain
MQYLKQFILKYLEAIIVILTFVAAFVGTYLIEEVALILNFYYLPVLVSSYLLGRRKGILVALLSILNIGICAILFPQRFFAGPGLWNSILKITSWMGFLFLASVIVGTLYEQNEHRLRDLKNAYIGIIEILAKYLESTDRYTKGHSVRVAELSMATAIAMELPRGEVDNIRAAALLHDIGKIEVSAEVLQKASQLSKEEKEFMDAHSMKGGYILASVGNVLKDVIPIVIDHHKLYIDTTDSKKGDIQEIPLGARIVAVSDAFDAMTTDRPYRKGIPPRQALEEIEAKSGKQFDPGVVEAFKRVINERMGGADF